MVGSASVLALGEELERFVDPHSAGLCTQENPSGFSNLIDEVRSKHMHAILNRYEGVDASRTIELTKKVNETLIPRLSKLPGFDGYFLIKADDGVITSISLFDTPAHADESARLASSWVRDEKLESVLPNAPMTTFGEVVAKPSNGGRA
jgi:hypothetical protein